MRHALKLLSGVVLGAGVIYLLDQKRGGHRRAVSPIRGKTVKRTMTISAPIDHVFNFWRHYDETFPPCLTRVKHITTMNGGRARWVVNGAGATDVIWTTVVTRCSPNKELAWETER